MHGQLFYLFVFIISMLQQYRSKSVFSFWSTSVLGNYVVYLPSLISLGYFKDYENTS